MGFEFQTTEPTQDLPPQGLESVPPEKPSEAKAEDDFTFTQEDLWEFELDHDYYPIIERRDGFERSIERYASRLVRNVHMWNRMVKGLVNDEKFGSTIDEWKDSSQRLVDRAQATERYEDLKTLFADEESINRAVVLDALLLTTDALCENEQRTLEEQETLQILNENWVILYTRWKEVRLQQLRKLFLEWAPRVEETKKDLVEFCTEEFSDFITKEGAERVFFTPVMIKNDFSLSEDIQKHGGQYEDSTNPFGARIVLLEYYVRQGVKYPEFGYSLMGHEATHAFSGHGEEERREKSNIGDRQVMSFPIAG